MSKATKKARARERRELAKLDRLIEEAKLDPNTVEGQGKRDLERISPKTTEKTEGWCIIC